MRPAFGEQRGHGPDGRRSGGLGETLMQHRDLEMLQRRLAGLGIAELRRAQMLRSVYRPAVRVLQLQPPLTTLVAQVPVSGRGGREIGVANQAMRARFASSVWGRSG
ncbi:hypothetical protein [Micromonospora sp. NPDC004704]